MADAPPAAAAPADEALSAPGDRPESAETGGHAGAKLLTALLLLIPIAAALSHGGASPAAVFLCAIGGLVPLAGFLGRATEEIAIRSTPALGALLNASLGNAIELMIASQLLLGDDPDAPRIVRASVVGSLITNLLLLIGLSMIAGGLKHRDQTFRAGAVSVSTSLLIIAFAGVCVPTVYAASVDPRHLHEVSIVVPVILAGVYACGLVFTFLSHTHLFDTTDELRETRAPEWSLGMAVGVLVAAIAAVAYLAHLLEGTLEGAGHALHLSKTFVGVIFLGAITNTAEMLAAIAYARKNNIELPIHIGTSSAIQVVLFVVPLLVLIGSVTGHPFDLQFTPFELVAMAFPVIILNHLAHDGKCNWLEGVQLVSLYLILGAAFYFVP